MYVEYSNGLRYVEQARSSNGFAFDIRYEIENIPLKKSNLQT